MKCPLYRRGCEAVDPIDPAGVPAGIFDDCRYFCCEVGLRAALSTFRKPTNTRVMEFNGIELTVSSFGTDHKPNGRWVVIEPMDFRGRIVLELRDGRRIYSVQRVR